VDGCGVDGFGVEGTDSGNFIGDAFSFSELFFSLADGVLSEATKGVERGRGMLGLDRYSDGRRGATPEFFWGDF
jgi:hypothetical protein